MSAPSRPSSLHYKITGLKELNNFVANLSSDLRQSFDQTMTKYGSIMENQMLQRVPVRTGFLRSTIGKSLTQSQLKLFATAFYAGYVNYGTVWMPARPFFTGPIEENTPKLIDELNHLIDLGIKSRLKGGR